MTGDTAPPADAAPPADPATLADREPPADPAPPADRAVPGPSQSKRRQLGRAAFSLVVVGVVFIGVLPQIADIGDVWAQIRAMAPMETATLALVAVWNLVTYLFVVLPALPGLTWGQGVVVTQATTAASNVLPAGAAVGIGMTYAMYSSWGFPRSESALAILVSGVWNSFMKLGLPVLALVLLALQGDANVQRVTAGLVGIGALLAGIGIFWLMLRNDVMARRVGDAAGKVVSKLRRLTRRPPVQGWGEGAVGFRKQTIRLLHRSWARLTVGTIVSHLSLFLVLLMALRHVGVSEREVGWVEVLAAFAFVRLLSALPITPGGVGVGMTYAMYSSWGFPRSESALAILVSGVWNSFMKLGLPLLALVLLALQGDANVQRVTAGLVGIGALLGGIGIFWLMLRNDVMARRVGDTAASVVSKLRRLTRRPPVQGWGEGAVGFRKHTIRLLRRSWARLTVGTIVSHLSLYLVLLMALRHVGVSEREVGWVEVLAAFAFVRLLSALPITPGGVGVVELGLTAALVTAGGGRAQVVAAVLVFRALTYLLPVPVGLVCYVIWRRRASWRKTPTPEAPPRAAVLGGP